MPKTKNFLPKGKVFLDDILYTESVKQLIDLLKENYNKLGDFVFCYVDSEDGFSYVGNCNNSTEIALLEVTKQLILDEVLSNPEKE